MRCLFSGPFILMVSATSSVVSAEPSPSPTVSAGDAPSQASPPQASPPGPASLPPYATAPYAYPPPLYGAPVYPPPLYGPPPYPRYCPPCPPGTLCNNGFCIPAYPYPCPPGMVLVASGSCAPVDSNVDTGETRAEWTARTAREKRRLLPKLTVDLEFSLGLMGDQSDPVFAPTFAFMVGFRRNFLPWFGLIVRGGPLIGAAIYEDSSPTYSSYDSTSNGADSTRMTGLVAEVLPYFGPFRRFYFAPSISLVYLRFDKAQLRSGDTHVDLDSTAAPAMGFHAGWVLGGSEKTVLYVGGRIAPLNTVTLFLTVGVGFQIF